MSTKGASNRYGNARGSRRGSKTIHTGFAWAAAFNRSTLDDHFSRHGKQLGCPTKESYNANAVSFANTVDRKNCVSFIDKQGSTYKYNKKTNTLAIITKKVSSLPFTSHKAATSITWKKRGRSNNEQRLSTNDLSHLQRLLFFRIARRRRR